MNSYELTYLVSSATAGGINHIDQIEKIVKEKEGAITVVKKPERINLAYPIKKNITADIVTVEINIAPDKIKIVEDKIKLNKHILRYILIKRMVVARKKERREKKSVKNEEVEHFAPAKKEKEREREKEKEKGKTDSSKTSKLTKTKLEDIEKKLDEML